MGKNRLEAFSDGVLAIIITIMVLELKVPHGATFADLSGIWPIFVCYVLSFVYIGIYWNNHHHLLHAVGRVTGGVLWANLHLLFWLSLVPFSTGWMGENHFAPLPTAIYGANLMLAGAAYFILSRVIIASDGCEKSLLGRALGADAKGQISLLLYALSIPLAFVMPWLADVIYGLVAVIWLVPDRRIERVLSE